MSALETYLKACATALGGYRVAAIRNLRMYMNLTSEDELVMAIMQITDPTLLRYLWAAGLTSRLQQVVIAQQEKLAKGA